jgi:hypothetical protein
MRPGISQGLRARLPAIFLLGFELYVLIGFGAFEMVIAAQEWRYRRGNTRLAQAVRHRRDLEDREVWVTTTTYVNVIEGPPLRPGEVRAYTISVSRGGRARR